MDSVVSGGSNGDQHNDLDSVGLDDLIYFVNQVTIHTDSTSSASVLVEGHRPAPAPLPPAPAAPTHRLHRTRPRRPTHPTHPTDSAHPRPPARSKCASYGCCRWAQLGRDVTYRGTLWFPAKVQCPNLYRPGGCRLVYRYSHGEDDPKEVLEDYIDDVQVNLAVCMYMLTSKLVRTSILSGYRYYPDFIH